MKLGNCMAHPTYVLEVLSAAANLAFSLKVKSFVYVFSGALDPASFLSSTFPDFKTSIGSKIFGSSKGDVRTPSSSG